MKYKIEYLTVLNAEHGFFEMGVSNANDSTTIHMWDKEIVDTLIREYPRKCKFMLTWAHEELPESMRFLNNAQWETVKLDQEWAAIDANGRFRKDSEGDTITITVLKVFTIKLQNGCYARGWSPQEIVKSILQRFYCPLNKKQCPSGHCFLLNRQSTSTIRIRTRLFIYLQW